MHVAAPAALNWPQAQSLQLPTLICPVSARLLPAVQAMHATCAGWSCQRPGVQLVQAAAPADDAAALFRNLPAAHAVQLVCASRC